MQFDDPHFLVDREDITVTTDEKNEAEDCSALPCRTWVITQKLEETALSINQEDIKFGRGPGYTAGKFLCYSADDSSKKPAFMRIYAQIPMDGTEGFITFVVWEKVAGEPLDYDEFWNMNYNMRDSIRRKFRATYPKLLHRGIKPCIQSTSKLIVDTSTEEMYVMLSTP
ncbi:hypothetical protein N7536_000274 [Penicillium majusculum]|nr:hypothetical protein N7536_000274 [Penicillium majusculum]